MSQINEISLMDNIFEIEHKVFEKSGIQVNNVSHWDSSLKFQQSMNRVLQFPREVYPWNYHYSYSILEQHKKSILSRIGVTSLLDTVPVIFPSSTISIVNVLNLLSHCGKKKLCILQPSYFSVGPCCEKFGIDYDFEYITFDNYSVQIPIDNIINNRYDCIWITNPIYSAGILLEENCIKQLLSLKETGMMLVFDESLMMHGYEIARNIDFDINTIAIYSPHKSISMNGIKFSAVICNSLYEDFFDHWIDVFSGALSSSNRNAVYHYISDNYFNDCLPQYSNYIENVRTDIKSVISHYPYAYTYPNCIGHYMNVFTNISFNSKTQVLRFIENISQKCYTSLIPGIANGYSPKLPFSFRINLTGDNSTLPYEIGNILEQIKSF